MGFEVIQGSAYLGMVIKQKQAGIVAILCTLQVINMYQIHICFLS